MSGDLHDAVRGFEAAVEHYRRGRPGYPDDAVAYLVRELRLEPGCELVELGAGTGKLTELLVLSGARIVAVEPLPVMREALRLACPTVEVLDGTGERIPVADASADAVVAAQSFHWFDGDRALPEIHRVLREGGQLALMWNVRDEASDWSERLTAIFDRLAGPDAPRYRTGRWRAAFERTELFGPLHHQVAYHVHTVTREAFIDRVLSVSYVATATPEERERVLAEVNEMLDTDPELRGRSEIIMPYRTDVFRCVRR
ncbi:MAG TPA: class I SAM-dependent methyltransferase [Actinomycetota bacterium]